MAKFEKLETVESEELVQFDDWYASKQALIPTHHYKEIILADFKGRKVAMLNTVTAFDEALAKYGIKL